MIHQQSLNLPHLVMDLSYNDTGLPLLVEALQVDVQVSHAWDEPTSLVNLMKFSAPNLHHDPSPARTLLSLR